MIAARFTDWSKSVPALIEAVRGLYSTLSAVKGLEPRAFGKRMSRFGDALKAFDSFDQTSSRSNVGAATVFFVFDTLVRLAAGRSAAASKLRIRANAGGVATEKMLG